MKKLTVLGEMHIFEGRPNGGPIRLVLELEGCEPIRLQGAGDGQSLKLDRATFDEPIDMGKYGKTQIVDLTSLIFSQSDSPVVTDVAKLTWSEFLVGLCLNPSEEPFFFWNDGDEFHWGNRRALESHDWLDGVIPSIGDNFP